MNDRDLFVEIKQKHKELRAFQEEAPGFDSFVQAAYEMTVEGLFEALDAGKTRWKYFSDVSTGLSIPVAWALNGGISLINTGKRIEIWARDPEEMLEQAREIGLAHDQILPHPTHEGLYQAILSDAQARRAPDRMAQGAPPPEVLSEADEALIVEAIPAIDDSDYVHSTYREKLLEHVFVSEVLQEAWIKDKQRRQIEVLRSEIDASGYDIVLVSGAIIRHIQLKASRVGARTAKQNINLKLADKPAGCVVWMEFTEDIATGRLQLSYRFFGGRPTEPLPIKDGMGQVLPEFKAAKHTKANSLGIKAVRPGIIQVPLSKFVPVQDGMTGLLSQLFG